MGDLTSRQREILARVQSRRSQKQDKLTPKQQEILTNVEDRRRQNMGWGEWAADQAKSAGVGLGEGVIGLGGMVSDIGDLTATGAGKAVGFFGGDEDAAREKTKAAIYFANLINPATAGLQMMGPSAKITKAIEDNVTGPFYEPKSKTGKYTRSVASFVPGAALGPGGLARAGVSAVGGGLVSEGAGQLAQGTGYEAPARLAGGLGGSLAGLGLGNLTSGRIPGQTMGSRSLLKDNSEGALTFLQQADGVDMMLNANRGFSGLAGGLASKGGKPANMIAKALEDQVRGKGDRLNAGTNSIFGHAKDLAMVRKAMDRLTQKRVGPLYKNAVENAQPLDRKVIEDILAVQLTDPARTMSAGKRAVNMNIMGEIEDALAHDNPSEVISHLHGLRKEFDSKIVWDREAAKGLASSEKDMQDVLKNARSALDDILKNRAGFARPDAIYARNAKAKGDLETGYDSLDGGKYAMSPEVFSNKFAKGDKQAIRTGMRSRVDNMVGTQINDLLALKKAMGGDRDWNRLKMEETFGKQATDAGAGMVNREAKRDRDFQDILGNSRTAQRTQAAKQIEGMTESQTPAWMTMNIAGVPVHLLQKGYVAVKDAALRRKSDASGLALAKALSLKRDEAVEFLKALKRTKGVNAADFLRAALNAYAATAGK